MGLEILGLAIVGGLAFGGLAACAGGADTNAGGYLGPGVEEDSGDESETDTPDAGPEGTEAEEIDAYLRGLDNLPVDEPALLEQGAEVSEEDGDYVCTTQNFLETKQFDKIVAFAANSNTLYPGAWLAGDAVSTGLFTPLVLDRAPLTFSASLEGVLDGHISATMEKPSLSAFREAMNELLSAEVTGNTAANIAAHMAQIHSAKQLELEIGADLDYLSASLSTDFNFSKEEIRSRYLVEFTQTYYTVDIDAPAKPSSMLDDSVSLVDVKEQVGEVPPVYVSGVSYGRLVYFTFTSELSAKEVRSAIDFAFRGIVSVDASVSLNEAEILERTEITAHILGGNGNDAVKAIHGLEELRAFIEQGGVWSKESPGAPIAYKLAYVADNKPARHSLTTDYDLTECDRINQGIRVRLTGIRADEVDDGGGNVEVFGSLSIVTNQSVDTLFDVPESQAISLYSGVQWPYEGEIDSSLVKVTPQPGHAIDVHLQLQEDDSGLFSSDDAVTDNVIDLRFEDGWRREVVIPVASGGNKLSILLSLEPV